MLELSTINPLSFPSVAIEERAQLPRTSAVYFCLAADGQILYIGRARNLKQRWGLHHRYGQLKKIGGVKIAYFDSPVELLDEIEQALINWFQPPLNTSSIKRDGKTKGIRVKQVREVEIDGLGERIKQARLAIAPIKSLEQICDEVGVSRTYWYDIEKETLKGALSIENLRLIEQALGIDLGVCFDG